MIKILTVVGARPQFIKAAMVSRAIVEYNLQAKSPSITEEILHTGQHYDINMSEIFFRQMEIPEPVVNLHAGTGMHGEMTGRMLAQIEKEIINRKPDWVLVYGDTNSTLAGALAAVKIHVPVVHVEAGLRSFNKGMPEEINRILTDHVSTLLLCPTHSAAGNLKKEGIVSGVYHVGDVMYDAALMFGEVAAHKSTILHDLNLVPKQYHLATVHRAENTDDPIRLQRIFAAFNKIGTQVVLPIHPRTKVKLDAYDLQTKGSNITLITPVSFLDMVQLERNACCILTDSGGVQKEAYFHSVPCITLRDETEWLETVEAGWNQVVGADSEKIIAAVSQARAGATITEYGQGNASSHIRHLICLATSYL